MKKYWSNLDANDQNFLCKALIAGILTLCVLYILYYFIDIKSNGRHTLFFIKSFGTLFTITGVLYAIHIQLKLKSITELLQDNSEQIHENISTHYVSWNIQKAISLSSEVEQSLISKNYAASVVLIRILKEILTDCKKSFFNDFERELNRCIKCLEIDDNRSLEEIVIECKEKCNFDIQGKLKRNNKKLAVQLVNITKGLSENNKEINVQDGFKIINDIRQILNDIKPSPIKSI